MRFRLCTHGSKGWIGGGVGQGGHTATDGSMAEKSLFHESDRVSTGSKGRMAAEDIAFFQASDYFHIACFHGSKRDHHRRNFHIMRSR